MPMWDGEFGEQVPNEKGPTPKQRSVCLYDKRTKVIHWSPSFSLSITFEKTILNVTQSNIIIDYSNGH